MDSMQYTIGSNLAQIRKTRELSLDKVAELFGKFPTACMYPFPHFSGFLCLDLLCGLVG
ncbi:hypothetical protein ACIFQM_10185 [Paenibacillus sp. NRS-1782]|uniref:hypothetical protein n=1 Tax=unclassified Paenibacillus TaxID=185978 RepID=UPI003D2CDCEA